MMADQGQGPDPVDNDIDQMDVDSLGSDLSTLVPSSSSSSPPSSSSSSEEEEEAEEMEEEEEEDEEEEDLEMDDEDKIENEDDEDDLDDYIDDDADNEDHDPNGVGSDAIDEYWIGQAVEVAAADARDAAIIDAMGLNHDAELYIPQHRLEQTPRFTSLQMTRTPFPTGLPAAPLSTEESQTQAETVAWMEDTFGNEETPEPEVLAEMLGEPPAQLRAHMPAYMPVIPPAHMPVVPPFDMPDQMPAQTPPNMPAMIPADMPVDMPADMPAQIPAQMPADMPAQIPAQMPIYMPALVPAIPAVPELVPAETPIQMPVQMPGETTNEYLARFDRMHPIGEMFEADPPAQMPAQIPAQMPADPPVQGPVNNVAPPLGQLPAQIPIWMTDVVPNEIPGETQHQALARINRTHHLAMMYSAYLPLPAARRRANLQVWLERNRPDYQLRDITADDGDDDDEL